MGQKLFHTIISIFVISLFSITAVSGQDCYPPDYSEVQAVTSTTATLYWEDYNGNTSWNIVASTSMLDDPSAVPVTATVNGSSEFMTHTLQGLSPETNYYYYIQAHCGANDNSDWIEGTFTTRCADKTIPHTENFDSYGSNQNSFPTCWTKIQGLSHTAFVDATHMNILRLRSNAAVAAPTFNQPINTLRINFEAWTANINVPVEVGVMEDLEDWETFTVIETINLSAASTFFQKEVHFDTYTGNGRYIVFNNPGIYDNYIDNLTVSVIPNCLNPVNVAVDNITANSAVLSWEEMGTATQWRVLVSPTPITNFNNQNPITCNSTTYTANSLTPNTTYYFYVQSVCSGENSEWSNTTFTTLCGATSLPTSEPFAVNQVPDCWSRERLNGTADVTFVAYGSLPSCHPAEGAAMVKWSSATNGANWQARLISLPLSTTGSSALDVNFKWFHDLENSNGTGDGVQIQYSTDGVNWANSTQGLIRRYDGVQSGWTEYDVIVPEAGNRPLVYVGFLFNTGSGGYNCYLDEVTFRAASGCYTPVNVTVSNINGNGATITWDEVGSANNWEVLVSGTPVTDFSNVSPVSVTTPTRTINNLNPTTDYYVYVRSKCSGNSYSAWTPATLFTTTCGTILNLPYGESFDTYGTCSNAFPPCWVRHGQPDLGNFYHDGQYCSTPSATDIDAIDGDKSLMICTPSGSFTYTITPPLQEDIRNLAITFFLQKSAAQMCGSLEVGVMSDPNDLATFESITTVEPTAVNTWEYFPVSFANANLSGTGNRIAFRHHGEIDNNYYLLDGITFMTSPDCWPAGLLTANDITGNSVTLSWIDPNEPSAQWHVKISDSPMTDMNQTANVFDQTISGTTLTLDYLSGGRTYYYYVRSDCGNNALGLWSHNTFTTLPCNCYVDIYMNDAYSNGWEGAMIQMKHGSTVFAEVTMTDGAHDTARVYTCSASNIDYYFVSGSYDSDISFTIVNSLGTTIYTSNGTPNAGCFTSGVPACGISCLTAPGSMTATATANGNSLTWTSTPNALTYSVYRNNTLIANFITTTSYTDTEPVAGENCYTVTANCIAGESYPSDPSCVTGIDERPDNRTVNLFPNPARDRFTITADFPISRVSVVNLLGQEVINREISDNRAEISTSGLSNGIYLVKILDGQRWIVRKIVIE